MKGAAGGRPSARTGGQPTAAADRQRPAAPRDSGPQAANLAPSAHQYACRCIQLNVRGMLASKSRAPAPPPCLDLIRDLNSTGKNLALLSETWGDPAAPLPGWTCISRPRPTDPKHGGVAILVRSDIAATEILTDCTANGLGGAITGVAAQNQLQTALDDGIQDGSIAILFKTTAPAGLLDPVK